MKTSTPAVKAKDSSSSPVEFKHQEAVNRLNDQISRRAYDLFERDGRGDGQDLAHWLQAEGQVVRPIPQITESSLWYSVNVPLKDFTNGELSVGVEPTRAVIIADRADFTNGNESVSSGSVRESLYLVAHWPSEVDPATASAYVKNESLTLTVKRATPATSAAK